MNISSALNNALSGLTATARAVNVTSSNLANVLTEGYATRELGLVSQASGAGSGVLVTGVTRHVDMALLSERRFADAELAYSDKLSEFVQKLERTVGTPDQPNSLSARLASLDASLITAASKPESTDRLQAVAARAAEVSNAISSISNEIQDSRTQADGEIAFAVDGINTVLGQIHKVNAEIIAGGGKGTITAALEDQRQGLIDTLSEFIPVQQVPRERGGVALFTPGGAILLDGTAATLSFTATNVVTPYMSVENGLLSGLEINGISIKTSGNNSPIKGGRLAALFEIRDAQAPDAQTQIDALARDLIDRFQDPGVDPTLGASDAGLFTDNGAAFDSVDEVGIAGRITLNAAVDPGQGGALWRLRDGLGAGAPGASGDASLLQAMKGALSSSRSLASGDLGATARSAAGHTAGFLSRIGQNRLTLETAQSFAAAQQNELVTLERQNGVDTDSELQKLLLIEQAYAANVRMIETADEMIQTLLRI